VKNYSRKSTSNSRKRRRRRKWKSRMSGRKHLHRIRGIQLQESINHLLFFGNLNKRRKKKKREKRKSKSRAKRNKRRRRQAGGRRKQYNDEGQIRRHGKIEGEKEAQKQRQARHSKRVRMLTFCNISTRNWCAATMSSAVNS
jgi:hypothetical protein